MKDLIHLFKYRNKTSLRILFGKLSADFVTTYNIPLQNYDMIVPVPLHSTRLREREYNQTDILANELAHYFPIQVCSHAVKRIRNTKPQATLKARQRLSNLQDAFSVTDTDLIKDKNILLFDDLFTTGATVSEMARVLTSSGAHEVSVLTLAIAQ
ncbi:ComF family protein [Candidatus Omnitrophota bacterium]